MIAIPLVHDSTRTRPVETEYILVEEVRMARTVRVLGVTRRVPSDAVILPLSFRVSLAEYMRALSQAEWLSHNG